MYPGPVSARNPPYTRKDAIAELDRHGIRGTDTYLIDVLPLIEMMWADGTVQEGERGLLDKFMRQHVDNLNVLAGYKALSYEDGTAFVDRFLRDRPPAAVLEILRKLIPVVRWNTSDTARNAEQRRAVLRWCLDIGAQCVTEYPHGDHERFCEAEKSCFEQIFSSLR